MNTVGLLAVVAGLALLYRHYSAQPTTGTGTTGNTPPPTDPPTGTVTPAPTTNPPTNTTTPYTNPTPTQQQTLPITQATPLAAAGDRQWAQVLSDKGIAYTVDEWNYYRVQGGQPPIDAADMPTLVNAEEEGMRINANDYLNRLSRLNVTAWHTL